MALQGPKAASARRRWQGSDNILSSRRYVVQRFQGYLHRLESSDDKDIQIHWSVIDIDAVDAKDHSTSASLQLADATASAFAAGVEPNHYGNCEPRYAEILKPITYERRGNYLSYGVKVVPKPEDCGLTDEQGRFIALFE